MHAAQASGRPHPIAESSSLNGFPQSGINTAFVLSVRPDPADLDRVSLIKLQDGETIRVRGEHSEVAEKPARSH
jgi:hypothetical protein